MTSLDFLLTLPRTSDGLTNVKPTTLPGVDDGSGSPPRKVARLAAGSDSASASRSMGKASSIQRLDGPIRIQVIGNYMSKAPPVEKQLALLRQCIRLILFIKPEFTMTDTLPATFEGVYNACRSVVSISNQGEDLYNILKIELEQSISKLSRLLGSSPEEDVAWLALFNRAFAWLEEHIALLASLLTYLDQIYVVQHKDVLNVHDLAYLLIGEQIFGSAQVVDRLHKGVKTWLEMERRTRTIHPKRAFIPTLINHLIRHHQYSNFEAQYVDLTQAFYIAESAEKAEELKEDPKAFFKHARARIDEESARVQAVLPIAAWSVVGFTTEWSLWAGRTQWVASKTLPSYMEEKNSGTLAKMYTLFSRVEATKALSDTFGAYIRTTVASIVTDTARDDDMVQRLLDFKELADKTVSTSFLVEKLTPAPATSQTPTASTSKLPSMQPDQVFLYAITDAFNMGFKARRSKPAEMIAKYVDKAMRKGQGKASDAEFQALLDKVLALYRFTDDKDVFRTFYHRSLAKRLLLERSASDDFEKAILKKLKENYDPEFGMGEEMFKDLSLSRESMKEYHSKLPEGSPGRKLNAMVLQRSAWPFAAQKNTVDLPPSMQDEITKYTEFYKAAHSGHVLDWNHNLGTATLKARFNAGVKELSVSLYQAIVLLLFNDAVDIPFADIKEMTGMEDAELRRTLQSLACGKKKVLKKIPPGKDVNDSDMFRYNADFDDPHAKVHINSIQVKVSPEESKRTNASIEDDRKHYLDAAIVRIMKARKEMTYEQLKAATIDAVKSHFVPQVETIKRRIDSLVETEYLERSTADKNVYKYVA
ncbi:Cullin-4B [Pholiota conissans]|uniref:Cullin-4B n=1 Tax=Pholiota conissans TaxID=109636 RepID=A0A9P5Z6Y1_9AGAR|nr:Cullin-4B [Pholiota conissans]